MTMRKALYTGGDIDRRYVLRREGERGLASIKNSIDISIQRLEDYIEKCEGRLITGTRNNTNDTWTSRTTITENKSGKKKNSMDVSND